MRLPYWVILGLSCSVVLMAGPAGAEKKAEGTEECQTSQGAGSLMVLPEGVEPTLDDICDTPVGMAGVCMLVTGDGPQVRVTGPKNRRLRPNRAVRVVVAAKEADSFMIERCRRLENRSAVAGVDEVAAMAMLRARGAPTKAKKGYRIFERGFPALTQGQNHFRIEVRKSNPLVRNQLMAKHTETFFVEHFYRAAAQLGIGLVPARLTGVDFTAETVGDSQQTEIVAGRAMPLDIDLLLGFSFFLGDGRAESGCDGWNCFAPYLGFGIVSPRPDRVDWFKSFHLGLDYELTRALSLSLTATLRNVEVLRDGYVVGGPINPGEDFTESQWRLGAGVVFNCSLSFLGTVVRVLTQGGA